MTPTYDQVIGWKPESLGDIASAARTLQTDLDGQAPKAGDPVINLTAAEWKGLARTAADGRAESITRWLRSLSDQYGTLAAALDNGKTAIRGAMTTLQNQRSTAAALGYELRTNDPAYNVDFNKSKAPDGAEYDEGTAREFQEALLGFGRAADTAVSNANSAISTALSGITSMTPASIAQNSTTIDPTKAATDTKAILDGTATPEQHARFELAMQLTPEQLARLQAGQRIDISPEQLLYIKHATGAVDVGDGRYLTGISAFNTFGTDFGRPPASQSARAALANGLQILSNENVHAGGMQGSFNLLPQTIKDVLGNENPVTRKGNSVVLTGVSDASKIGKLLQVGDPRYQAGTTIDRSLGELGRKYTDAIALYEQELQGKSASGMWIDGQTYINSSNSPFMEAAPMLWSKTCSAQSVATRCGFTTSSPGKTAPTSYTTSRQPSGTTTVLRLEPFSMWALRTRGPLRSTSLPIIELWANSWTTRPLNDRRGSLKPSPGTWDLMTATAP